MVGGHGASLVKVQPAATADSAVSIRRAMADPYAIDDLSTAVARWISVLGAGLAMPHREQWGAVARQPASGGGLREVSGRGTCPSAIIGARAGVGGIRPVRWASARHSVAEGRWGFAVSAPSGSCLGSAEPIALRAPIRTVAARGQYWTGCPAEVGRTTPRGPAATAPAHGGCGHPDDQPRTTPPPCARSSHSHSLLHSRSHRSTPAGS